MSGAHKKGHETFCNVSTNLKDLDDDDDLRALITDIAKYCGKEWSGKPDVHFRGNVTAHDTKLGVRVKYYFLFFAGSLGEFPRLFFADNDEWIDEVLVDVEPQRAKGAARNDN